MAVQDEDLDIPGYSKAGSKTRFSRTAWGLEIWELLNMSMSLLYEPELQVQNQINVNLYDFCNARWCFILIIFSLSSVIMSGIRSKRFLLETVIELIKGAKR